MTQYDGHENQRYGSYRLLRNKNKIRVVYARATETKTFEFTNCEKTIVITNNTICCLFYYNCSRNEQRSQSQIHIAYA